MERRTVGIFVFEDVEVLDFAGPFEVFSRTRTDPGPLSRRGDDAGPLEVLTVARSSGLVNATGGLRVVPHCSFEDAPPIDILVVPGGFGTRLLMDDDEVLRWIRSAAERAQLVTSVCTGSILLARAGLLEGKSATTHWAAYELLELQPGVTVRRDLRWVDDGVISSAGVSAGIDMAFYVVEKLFGGDVADETASYIDYPRRKEGGA